MPMALPRRSGGKVNMSTVMTIGVRIPAPAACRSLPRSRTAKLGPHPAIRLPSAKVTIDTVKSRLTEKRSVKKAVMGIMMALTRVKPVVSHWATEASTFISTMMAGSAGVTRVWLSTVTKVPKIDDRHRGELLACER